MNKLLATLIIAACGGLAVNSYAADSASTTPTPKAEHTKKAKSHSAKHASKEKTAKHEAKTSEPK